MTRARRSPGPVDRALTAILRSPPLMALKSVLREFAWRSKARTIANPELPAAPRRIEFVCTGNICRSPYAAARCEQILERRGIRGIACDSSGLRARPGSETPEEARRAAGDLQGWMADHRSRRFAPGNGRWPDVVMVMEVQHRQEIERRFPSLAGKVVLLAGLDERGGRGRTYLRWNIADPFGLDRAAFDACFRRIDAAVEELADRLDATSGREGRAPS